MDTCSTLLNIPLKLEKGPVRPVLFHFVRRIFFAKRARIGVKHFEHAPVPSVTGFSWVFRKGAERSDEMMKNKHTDYSSQKKNRQSRGFAVAAGICLIAIGVAAWAAYDSVVQEPLDTGSEVSITETPSKSIELPTPEPEDDNQAVAGSVASSETESPSPSPTAEPTPRPVSLDFPVGQKVLKRFSKGEPVYSETMKDWRVHNGVDFEAQAGEAVKAMAEGTVKDVAEDALLGHVVVITHDNVEAWYCGLGEKVTVKKGDTIKAGQEIGLVDVCPMESAEAAHFHLQIRQGEEWVDPLSLLMKEEK